MIRSSGVNIMTMQVSAVRTVFKAGPSRLYRTRKELPRKKATNSDKRMPVDLVKVLTPKKMHAKRTAEVCGM